MPTTEARAADQETKGRPSPTRRPKPARIPSYRERLAELVADHSLAVAEVRRAGVALNLLRATRERALRAELTGKLPEHALAKLDGADVLATLRDDVETWAVGQAGVSGDPKPPPASAAILYLLEKDEAGFRTWLGEQISALAADPSREEFTSRERAEIEADLEKVRAEIVAAEAKVEAAEATRSAAAQAINQA
ncbi:MAG: hypothetical protein QOI10_2187 [Solirubrobacterales bacterium]|jgi:hypothetical protein|nr:hypothetical protein [Solirubrobacterales bacterium]